MNKEKFLEELKKKLKRLPQIEIDNALNYYEEFLGDAGDKNIEKTISALGTPSAVAAKIIGEYAINDANFSEQRERDSANKNPQNIFLVLLLSLFAIPFAIPVLITIGIFVIAIFAVMFGVFAAGVGTLVGGLATGFVSIKFLLTHIQSSIYFAGASLFLISLGLLAIKLAIFSFKQFLRALQKLLATMLLRRNGQ